MAEVVAQPVAGRVSSSISYVEWGAVLAGAVLAASLSFVLLTFGTGIGLSLLSPYPAHSYGRAAASIAALWLLVVPIAAFLIGGYVAGRMRAPSEGADEAQTEFRDGIHGALVWGVGILFGALLTFFAASATAQTGAAIGASADKGAVYAPALDTLFAPVNVADASPSASPATPAARSTTGAPSSSTPTRALEDHDGAERILASSVAAGHLGVADRTYLTALISQRTGLSSADAERRVDQSYEQARNAADSARKAGVVAALVTATALLIALAGAWYGAQRGGHHRDSNIPARFDWPRRPRPRSLSSG
jgi:hypothetical protein